MQDITKEPGFGVAVGVIAFVILAVAAIVVSALVQNS